MSWTISRLSGLLLAISQLAVADYTVTIATSNRGTWEGWGTSLAWWAAAFGDRDDIANIFFSLDNTQWGSQNLPGLGFNIARYNAGACSWNSYNGESMVVSPNMNPARQIEGYWINWASTDPASSSWNWNADAKQRNMMAKAKARGANRFELFSNSPMWWMCYNHNPSGADNGANDNLQSWNYQQHAVYMATVAEYAKNHWGITFEAVEPFNEPMATWWSATGTQEGCHFNVATQATVIPLLRTELNNRGLSGTMVAASDETSYDQAASTWNSLGSTAQQSVGRINVHGYQKSGGRRDILYSLANTSGKKLWNSEYGENDATGEQLVRNLMLDFRWLLPTAWVYWQALDVYGWGLIEANLGTLSTASAAQKYFALAQFTRHIREGMRILDGTLGNVIPAYDSANRRLVIVAVNWDAGQTITFNLSQFGAVTSGTTVRRWTTRVGSGDQYVSRPTGITLNGNSFSSYFDTGLIQTFEIDNVTL